MRRVGDRVRRPASDDEGVVVRLSGEAVDGAAVKFRGRDGFNPWTKRPNVICSLRGGVTGMGFLKRLIGKAGEPPCLRAVPRGVEITATLSEGRFQIDAVGESHHPIGSPSQGV